MFDFTGICLIAFEGAKFSGKIVPELLDLAERGIVRFVDIVFIQKDEDGNARTIELNDLEPEAYEMFVPMGEHVSSLFTNDDLEIGASKLPQWLGGGALPVGEPVLANLRQALVDAAAYWWSADRSLPRWSSSSSRTSPRNSTRTGGSIMRRGPNPPGPWAAWVVGRIPPGLSAGSVVGRIPRPGWRVGRGPNPPGPVGGLP